MNRMLLGMIILVLLGAVSCSDEVYPGAHWETMTPEEAGLDVGKLDQLRDFMQGRGCVVRHGRMVYTWGDSTERGDVASAVKPWYSFFLFKAVEDGRLPGVDANVSAYFPCLNGLNADLNYKDRGILFRHLATQTSCYGVSEAPGMAFDYNDWQMALFVDALFLHVYGVTHATLDNAVLHPLLTDVLQCEDNPTFMAFGEDHRPGRLGISPRDFCRFGYLFLHNGQWKGAPLLSPQDAHDLTNSPLPGALPRTQAEPAEMCPDQRSLGSERIPDNQCDHEGSYSWLWWINGVNRAGFRHWPDAPADLYAALGHHNGMRGMAVMPSLDMVVAWNDTALGDMDDAGNPLNTAFGLLRDAVCTEPATGQIMTDPKHPAWLVRNEDGDHDGDRDPVFLCGPGDPEDFLYRGKRLPDGTRDGDQMDIIEKMKETGANCLYVQAVRSHGGDGDATHNPFLESDPAKGLDERILQQWETWFAELDHNGITVFFILYDDSASLWSTGDAVASEEQAFVETIVRRFEHHRNWIWCVAEEYAEAFSAARVRNIAAVIRGEDKHQHVIAVHKNESLSFDEFAGDPVIGQFAVQYNKSTAAELHDGMLEAWRAAQGRYNLTMAEASSFGYGKEAREKFWACAMAGAYSMALGWCFDKPDAPSREDLLMCGQLVRFFESTDFNAMSPHDELRAGGTEYVLAAPGTSYIAYRSLPGRTVGVKSLKAGRYMLKWFDPATGRELSQDNVHVSRNGKQIWRRPRGFDGAVALYIKRVGP